jgi:hypothetical protein
LPSSWSGFLERRQTQAFVHFDIGAQDDFQRGIFKLCFKAVNLPGKFSYDRS